jgi:hypothetical protein
VCSGGLCGSLSGDAAVRSSLEIKQAHSRDGSKKHYFDITEDMNVDKQTTQIPPEQLEDVTPLLYTPLPKDLPTVKKDLLILMTVYSGNSEGYIRLWRLVLINKELG